MRNLLPKVVQVLHVEDSPSDAFIAQEELSRIPGMEFVITGAVRLDEALRRLSEQRFDVVLLDLGLPDSVGLSTFIRLQSANPDIPIIVVSGQDDASMGFKAVQAGAQDYLVKGGLEEKALPRAIRYAIERKRNVDALRLTHVQLRLLLDHSPAVLIAWKLDGENFTPHLVSENVTRMLGFPVPEVMAPGWWFTEIHPDDHDRVLVSIKAALIQGSCQTEYRLRHQDGTYRWVDDNRSVIRDSVGNPIEQVGIWTDITDRMHKDEALRLRETALSEVSQGVLISDEHRRIIYANPSFIAITGYGLTETLEQNCSFLQGPDTDPATVLRMRTALDAQQPFEGEILNYRQDGTPFWNELTITPFRGEKGGAIRFIGTLKDITARKATEAKLHTSETRYRSLAVATTQITWVTNAAGQVTESLPEWQKFTGQIAQETQGEGWVTALHPDDKERAILIWQKAVASCSIYDIEYRLRRYDGVYRHFAVRGVPVLQKRGELSEWVGSCRDITERKESEEALRIAHERLQLAVKASRAGTWDLDMHTGKVNWDEHMLALYGSAVESLEPGVERWINLLHPSDKDRCVTNFLKATKSKDLTLEVEFRIFRRDDGRQRVIRALGVGVRDADNKPVRMTGINWDVTEERLREEKLIEALAQEKVLTGKARAGERAKSAFLAGMSHEIRTPLNAILGFSYLIAQSKKLPSDCRNYIETLSSSGEALLRILNDVLDFSRLEANGLQIDASSFSPCEVIQDVQTMLAPSGESKGLDLQLVISDGAPPFLWNDSGRLRQVLINLASNAIKFTEKGSVTLGLRLPVSASGEARFIEFFVRDTGPGIPGENLGEIFEPFQQLDSSISRRYGGSGLGLSISKNLVRLMGGTISVNSRLGFGSEFLVSLPYTLPKVAMPCVSELPYYALDSSFAAKYPMRVMLVEDDLMNRKLMLVMLGKLGYDPIVAHNGCQAVDAFKPQAVDCILMDLQMPLKDGFVATQEIRKMEMLIDPRQRVYISALTANVAAEDQQRCYDIGMDDYVAKPIKWSLLAEMLIKAAKWTAAGVELAEAHR